MVELPKNTPQKHDQGKVRLELVPPNATLMIGEVMTYGAQKYAPNNYLLGNGLEPDRVIASALRHINAHLRGEETDSETGLMHLAHAGASVMMALEIMCKRKETYGWLNQSQTP